MFLDVFGDRSLWLVLGCGLSDEEDDVDDLEGIGCLGVLLLFLEFVFGNGIKVLGFGDVDVNDIVVVSFGVFVIDGYLLLFYIIK